MILPTNHTTHFFGIALVDRERDAKIPNHLRDTDL